MHLKRVFGAALAAMMAFAPPSMAGAPPAAAPTLRQLGGIPLWVPICSRRGLPGSSATTDTTNTYSMNQEACYAPSWGNVTAVKLVYAGFDLTPQGEMDRQVSATINASIYQPAALSLGIASSAATTTGATTIPFSGTAWGGNAISIGQQIVSTGIPNGDYVAGITRTIGTSNTVTAITVTLAAATTANTTNGQSFYFVGNIVPVTFGGTHGVTVFPKHDVIISDPISVQIAPGAQYWIRTYAAFSGTGLMTEDYPGSGSRIIANTYGGITYTEFDNRGTTANDQTLNPQSLSNTGGGYWGPVAVLGLVSPTAGATVPGSVLVIGDSIATGTGDLADSLGLQGYVQRSMENNVPFITAARGSTTAAMSAFRGDGQFSLSIGRGITDLLLELGRNDIEQINQTDVNLEANITSIAARYVANGIRVWCFTVPPTTISSDGWTTIANQSWIQTSYTAASTVASGSSSITLSGSTGVAAGQTIMSSPVSSNMGTTAAASGAYTLTLTGTTGLYVGQPVYGAGIPAGDTIASISSPSITLNSPTTAIIPANVTLNFGLPTPAGTTISAWNSSTKVATLSTPTVAAISSGATIYTGSQTASGAETYRRNYNSFLRNAINRATLGCYGIVDDDAYMADLGGSYEWRVDLGSASIDGVHPQAVLHQAAVSAGIIKPSMFIAH